MVKAARKKTWSMPITKKSKINNDKRGRASGLVNLRFTMASAALFA
jgi:hypothetical protein